MTEILVLKAREKLRQLFPESENLQEGFPLGTCAPPKDFSDVQCYVDLTNLKPQAVTEDIKSLCYKAKEKKSAAVCTFQKFTRVVSEELEGSGIGVCAVANFPGAGSDISVVKVDVNYSVLEGATEIDPVHPIHLIKEQKYEKYLSFMEEVVTAAKDAKVKVILETQLLTDEEIIFSTLLCWMAGVRGVKTSTGVNTYMCEETGDKKTVHATIRHIRLMRSAFGDVDKFGNEAIIKASGGIGDELWAKELIENGANRIGASSL